MRFITLVLLVVLSLPVIAEDKPDYRTINVKGFAKEKYIADQARLSFSVITKEDRFDRAEKENAKKADKVVRELKRLGLTEKEISLSGYQVQERKVYNPRTKTHDFDHFEGRRSYELKVTDEIGNSAEFVQKLSRITQILSKNEVGSIGSINFELKDADLLKENLLSRAVSNAKEKAVKMLAPLSARLGLIQELSEESFSPVYPLRRSMGLMTAKAFDESSSAGFTEEELELSAQVRAVFRILE